MISDSKDINFPQGYFWLNDRGIIGHKEFSQLQPWFYLDECDCFFVNVKWKNITNDNLFAFARRQDNDELACFKLDATGSVISVIIINGWSSDGFDLIQEYPDFWAWVHQVIDDVKEWSEC